VLHRNRLTGNRTGQGLPISTIIIAALGILVLVILGYMFSQKTSGFARNIGSTNENSCEPPYELKPVGTVCADVIYGNFKEANKICCKVK